MAAARRQILPLPSATTTSNRHHCTPFTIPADGYISIDTSSTVTLTSNVVYIPACTALAEANGIPGGGETGLSSIGDFEDPFKASVTPQVYATGAATVISWMLVIMLLITPRTFFDGGAGGMSGLRGRRGLISGASGGASVIGVGSRPWLQKVAAVSVAVSMTIATADTFRVAERQYNSGVMDANDLRNEVVGSLRIQVSRVISDIFLWLAQIQTLIRLFPRHKEKILIKWIGFAMIVLDATFSCLNTFMATDSAPERRFVDAIPALSYLFQLALSMLYAAWVLYYSCTKRRYAWYHKMMWNISLVALLSIVAILTPVVFFITDISNFAIAGWGDYFRWVGAAAASVIVWEWVERIEALEREEKKDGILGREVFDGDEMLDITPSEEVTWPGQRKPDGDGHGVFTSGLSRDGMTRISSRLAKLRHADFLHRRSDHRKSQHTYKISATRRNGRAAPTQSPSEATDTTPQSNMAIGPTPPQPIASPVSRTDTSSAASTLYAVRYYPASHPSPPMMHQNSGAPHVQPSTPPLDPRVLKSLHRRTSSSQQAMDVEKAVEVVPLDQAESEPNPFVGHWQMLNPFKRRKTLPPPEVRSGQVIEPLSLGSKENQTPAVHNYARWDLKARLGAFAAEQVDRMREGNRNGRDGDVDLPVTIIPAQPRGRTWSPEDPDMLAQAAAPANGAQMGTIAESLESGENDSTSMSGALVDLGRADSDRGHRREQSEASQFGSSLGSPLSLSNHSQVPMLARQRSQLSDSSSNS